MTEPREPYSTVRLREQASILRDGQITAHQLEAMERIVTLLADAVKRSNVADEHDTVNRLILLAGPRGAGKSSVVSTLRSWMDPHSVRRDARAQHEAARAGDRLDEAPALKDLKRQANALIEEVDWLIPLQLDPLPPNTNLVAAVFSRISKEASRRAEDFERQRQHGLLEQVGRIRQAVHDIDNLKNHAVSAWESNLEQRALNMDPESFANHVNDVEIHKLELKDKLDRALSLVMSGTDDTARKYPGVFVLTIDDIDMRPGRAAEVLRLAYSLNVHRLVVLLVGSSEAIEEAVAFDYERELCKLANDPDPSVLLQIKRDSVRLAASSIRKMLPLLHRADVKSMRRAEAAAILTQEGRNLAEALKIFRIPEGALAVGPSITLANLLSTAYYRGGDVLAAPPRTVLDLVDAVRDATVCARDAAGVLWKPDANKLFEELAADFASLIDEDADLDSEMQHAMRGAIEREAENDTTPSDDSRHGADWYVAPPRVARIQFMSADNTDLCLPRVPGLPIRATAHFARIERCALALGEHRLSEASAPMFYLLHDLARFGFVKAHVSRIIESDVREPFASTRWRLGQRTVLEVPWFIPRWHSFLHNDAFVQAWDDGIVENLTILHQPSKLDERGHAVHAVLVGVRALCVAAGLGDQTLNGPGGPAQGKKLLELVEPQAPKGTKTRGAGAPTPGGTATKKWEFSQLALEDVVRIFEISCGYWRERHLVAHEDDDLTQAMGEALADALALLTPEVLPGLQASANQMVLGKVWAIVKSEDYADLLDRVARHRLERLASADSAVLAAAMLRPTEVLQAIKATTGWESSPSLSVAASVAHAVTPLCESIPDLAAPPKCDLGAWILDWQDTRGASHPERDLVCRLGLELMKP